MALWPKKTPQEKADSFDAQYEESRKRGKEKQARGEHPYEVDYAIAQAGQFRRKNRRKGK